MATLVVAEDSQSRTEPIGSLNCFKTASGMARTSASFGGSAGQFIPFGNAAFAGAAKSALRLCC
jgi:hypothetical protein